MSVTCDRSVVFSTNKSYCHDITEILLKVALNTIKQTNNEKVTFIRGVASHEGDNLLIFYNCCASEIWPDKRVYAERGGGGSYKRETTVYIPVTCKKSLNHTASQFKSITWKHNIFKMSHFKLCISIFGLSYKYVCINISTKCISIKQAV